VTLGGFGILHPAGKLLTMRIALESPHDAAKDSTHPEVGHGLRCRPDNVDETSVSPSGQPGFPVVAAETEQVERIRRKTSSQA
jgi:hypothetical protein